MGLVVRLSGYPQARRNGLPRRRSTGCSSCGLTHRDRAALAAWSNDERHAVINTTENGTFAMLYDGQCWASHGVMRQPSGILLWNCITHMDIGRFSSMADALSAIDDGSDVIRQAPVANVYPIRGGMVRCA